MKKYKVSRKRAYWCTETAIIEAENKDEALDEFHDRWECWVEIDDVFKIGGDTYEKCQQVRELDMREEIIERKI